MSNIVCKNTDTGPWSRGIAFRNNKSIMDLSAIWTEFPLRTTVCSRVTRFLRSRQIRVSRINDRTLLELEKNVPKRKG